MTSLDTSADKLHARDMNAGAKQISELIGKTVRQANYLLETGQLPAFKIGRSWHMRTSTYVAHIESLERQAFVRSSSSNPKISHGDAALAPALKPDLGVEGRFFAAPRKTALPEIKSKRSASLSTNEIYSPTTHRLSANKGSK